MSPVALILLTILLLLMSSLVATIALIRRRVRDHHRVDPSVPADAPLSWTFDPRAPARLHRRLTRIGAATTRIVDERPRRRGLRRPQPESSPTHRAALELRRLAVALDRQVSRLALLPARTRRDALGEIATAVTALETAAGRLIRLHEEIASPVELSGEPDALERATEEVDLLARAHEELRRIDRRHGLETRPGGPAAADADAEPDTGSDPDPDPDPTARSRREGGPSPTP